MLTNMRKPLQCRCLSSLRAPAEYENPPTLSISSRSSLPNTISYSLRPLQLLGIHPGRCAVLTRKFRVKTPGGETPDAVSSQEYHHRSSIPFALSVLFVQAKPLVFSHFLSTFYPGWQQSLWALCSVKSQNALNPNEAKYTDSVSPYVPETIRKKSRTEDMSPLDNIESGAGTPDVVHVFQHSTYRFDNGQP